MNYQLNKSHIVFKSQIVFAKLLTFLFLGSFFINEGQAKKQTVVFNEEETVAVKVSKKGSVRLSVKGDRIQDVMGLDESTSFEKDEKHGFLYLLGVEKKQTISITTEGGTVQDLELVPDDKGASHIVLKSLDSVDEDKSLNDGYNLQNTSFGNRFQSQSQTFPQQTLLPNSSFQDAVIGLMKHVYLGAGSIEEIKSLGGRQTPFGIQAEPLRYLKTQGMIGEVFEVKNIMETPITLLEKDFCQIGDYAIAIGKKLLERDEKTLLVIVRRG